MSARSIRLLASALLLSACGSNQPESVGDSNLKLNQVPPGVHCLELTLTSATQQTKLIDVLPGAASTSLSLGVLPLGALDVTADAYDQTCATIGAESPTWTADPLTLEVYAGVAPKLDFVFRPLEQASGSALFAPSIVGLATTASASFARVADGSVQGWGRKLFEVENLSPEMRADLSDVQDVVGSDRLAQFECALKGDGSVWCRGINSNGQVGPNVPILSSTKTFVVVSGLPPTRAITAGDDFVCAQTLGNQVYCWGHNNHGQLGNGLTTDSATPVLATGNVARVVAGTAHACSISNNGSTVSCWGWNDSGQASARQQDELIPRLVGIGAAIELGLGSSHSCALLATGSVTCWGDNSRGQLGDGTQLKRTGPVSALGVSSGNALVGNWFDSCVRLTDGSVRCWGYGANGCLGDGAADLNLIPTPVLGLVNVEQLSAAGDHVCALDRTQGIACWGANYRGQIGDGTTTDRFVPTWVALSDAATGTF